MLAHLHNLGVVIQQDGNAMGVRHVPSLLQRRHRGLARTFVRLFTFDQFHMTIHIRNLSYRVTEDDLQQLLEEYGSIKLIALPTDRETGRKRGFAFVIMEVDAQEDAAISALDGADWMGRQLQVSKTRSYGYEGDDDRRRESWVRR